MIEGTMNVIQSDDIIRMHHLPRHFLPPDFNRLTEKAGEPSAISASESGQALEIKTQPAGRLPADYGPMPASPQSLLRLQQDREKELIHSALVESAGSVSRAARKLNISRQLLHYKIKKYNLK